MRLHCTFAASGQQFTVEVKGHDTVGTLRKVLAGKVGADPRTLVMEACSASLKPELRAEGAMMLDEDDVTLVNCLLRDGDFVSIGIDQSGTTATSLESQAKTESESEKQKDDVGTSVPLEDGAEIGLEGDGVMGSIVEHDFCGDDDDEEEEDSDDDGENAPLKVIGPKATDGTRKAFPESPTVFSREMLSLHEKVEKSKPAAERVPLVGSNDLSEAEMKQIEEDNDRRIKAMTEAERAEAVAEIKSVFSSRALENLELLCQKREKQKQKLQEQKQLEQKKDSVETPMHQDHQHHGHGDDDHDITTEEWMKIQEENQRIVDSMTDEERQKAIQQIMSTFSPEGLQRLQELRDNLAPKEKPEEKEPAKQAAHAEESPKEEKKKTETANPVWSAKKGLSEEEELFEFERSAMGDEDNPVKDWLSDAPPTEDIRPVDKIPSDELRFDFEGVIIPPGTDISVRAGLHHHGGDQWAAGYTLSELCYLSRSTFPSQRVTALKVLSRIMQRAWANEYGETHSDIGNILCDKYYLPSLLLMALSHVNLNVRVSGVTALYTLVVDPDEQQVRSEMSGFVRGDELYSINDGYTFKTQEDEDKEDEEEKNGDNEDDEDEDEEEEEEEKEDDKNKKKKEPKKDNGFMLDRFLRKPGLQSMAMILRTSDSTIPTTEKRKLAEVLERFVSHSHGTAARVARDENMVQALLSQMLMTDSYALMATVLRIILALCKSTKDAVVSVAGGDNKEAFVTLVEKLLLSEVKTVQPQFFECQSLLCDILVICRRAGVEVVDDATLVKICTGYVNNIETVPLRTVFKIVSSCLPLLPQSLVDTVLASALRTLQASRSAAGGKSVPSIHDIQPCLDSLHFLRSLVLPDKQRPDIVKKVSLACLSFMTCPFFHTLSLSTFTPAEFEKLPSSMRPLRCLPGLLDLGLPKGFTDGTYGARLAAASCISYAGDILYEGAKRSSEVRAAVNTVFISEQPGILGALVASVVPPAPIASLTPVAVMRYLQRPFEQEKLSILRLLSLTDIPCSSYYNAAVWTVADASGGDEMYLRDILRDVLLKKESLQVLSASSSAPEVVSAEAVSSTLLELVNHILLESAIQRSSVLTTEFAIQSERWQPLFVRMDDDRQHFLPLAKDWPLMFLRLGNELSVSVDVAQSSLQFLSWICDSPVIDYVHSVGAPMWMERLLEIAVLPCFLKCKAQVGYLFSHLVNDCNLRDVSLSFERSRSGCDSALTLCQQFIHLFDSESMGDDLMVAIISFLLLPSPTSGIIPRDFVSAAIGSNVDHVDEIRASVWRDVPHLLNLITAETMRKYNRKFSFASYWDHPESRTTLTFSAMCQALREGRMLKTRTRSPMYWVAVHQVSASLFGDMTTATSFSVTSTMNFMPPRTCRDIVMLPDHVDPSLLDDPLKLARLTEAWAPPEERVKLLVPSILSRCTTMLEDGTKKV